ncbi:hypothetical protein [Streptomyces sp. NPDC056061]|uniref:hypothetical protein n=1 Tax=Streptomyces sp. NPDC056061 TaxID=3345700 RepID=UPI0035E3898F
MTTQALDGTDQTISSEETGAATTPVRKPITAKPAEKNGRHPSQQRRPWQRLSPKKRGDGLPVVIWTVFFRSIVLIADYLLAFTTAMVVIPMLGVWLHQQSGASQGELTGAGTIAMWLTPLFFLVALLAVGEIAVMRAMWRWGTRGIRKIRDGRADDSRPAAQTHHQGKKNNRKRSK